MTQDLKTILDQLHSYENRTVFLELVYTPGNTDVADHLLALSPNSDILKTEIEYAKHHGNRERFVLLSKQFVDYYVEEGFGALLKNEIIRWGDQEIADYAIKELSTDLKKGREEMFLECSAGIADAFGNSEIANTLYEQLLKRQMMKKEKYPFSPAWTCVKLGRFDDAIDLYMKADYGWLTNAFTVAREHKPNRISDVAKHAFDKYKSGSHQEIFAEAAKILGKTDFAKNVLRTESENLKPDRPPRFYNGLINALMTFGMKEEAKNVVSKIAEHEALDAKIEKYYNLGNLKELAGLYEAIGEIVPAKDTYLIIIERDLKERRNASEIISKIETAFETTGDSIFLEKKMLALEQQGDYPSAAEIATALDKIDLAQAYLSMHQMIEDVKTIDSK